MPEEESVSQTIKSINQEMLRAINDRETLVIRNIVAEKLENLPKDLRDLGVVYNNTIILHDIREEQEEAQRAVLLPAGTPTEVANKVRVWLEDQTGDQGFQIIVKPVE